MNRVLPIALLTLCGLAPCAHGAVTLLNQARSISALTTFNGDLALATAPDFALFNTAVTSSTAFPTVGGGTGTNTATTTINCTVDPNAIRAAGSLAGSGGVALFAGTPTQVLGEATVVIDVDFLVVTPTPFSIASLARPSGNPGDVYEIRLRNTDAHDTIFEQDQTMPAAGLLMSGVLAPGHYTMHYRAELSITGEFNAADYGFDLQLPTPGAGAMLVIGGCSLARRRRR